MQRYQMQEKKLYELWEVEKHKKWAQWVKKLNLIDYSKASKTFYSEINRKTREEEQFGSIINCKGKLSKTLNEFLKIWRKFYEKLYSPSV